MSRKGENIRKRKDGRWEARYVKSRDQNGKIQYGYLYGKSYREVKDKKNRKISELSTEISLCNRFRTFRSDTTFETISRYWKAEIRHTVKDSTFSNYESILNNQLLPVIGAYAVKDISSKTIWYLTQSKIEQGFSTGTIHITMIVLKSILNYAQSEGLTTAEVIKYPRLSVGSGEIKIMDPQDYQSLENYLTAHLDCFTFGLLICMHTGIRVGELSGLRWEDMDFDAGKINIRRTVTRIKNLDQVPNPETNMVTKTILHIGSPKSANSIREIPLPDKLLELGYALKSDAGTYILTGISKCMEPRIIQRRYSALLKECGIPPIKIHSLRHQFSCRWVENGFDTKSLSEILGHTSVRTTLDLYVHIRPDTKRTYMNKLMESKM